MAKIKVQGFAEQGGAFVSTSGVDSVTKVEKSFPGCTVTVYNAGTVTLSSIFSDSGGTPKANPFTAGADASWSFYVEPGNYDITFSGSGVAVPFTFGDVFVTDAGVSGVPTTRTLTTTSPLRIDGGGVADLSADRTLALSMATNRLLGRSTAGTGSPEEITLGTNLSFTGTTLNATGGGGSPGGSSGQLQYNNAGAFGGTAGWTFTSNELTASYTDSSKHPLSIIYTQNDNGSWGGSSAPAFIRNNYELTSPGAGSYQLGSAGLWVYVDYGTAPGTLAARGNVHGMSISYNILSTTDTIAEPWVEHASIFAHLTAGTVATPIRAGSMWMTDFNLNGPIALQPKAMWGVSMNMQNAYNGQPSLGNSVAFIASTVPAHLTGAPDRAATTTYPVGVGYAVVGNSSGGSQKGFDVGVQIGGIAGGYFNGQSKIGKGITIKEVTDAGIQFQDPWASNTTAAMSLSNDTTKRWYAMLYADQNNSGKDPSGGAIILSRANDTLGGAIVWGDDGAGTAPYLFRKADKTLQLDGTFRVVRSLTGDTIARFFNTSSTGYSGVTMANHSGTDKFFIAHDNANNINYLNAYDTSPFQMNVNSIGRLKVDSNGTAGETALLVSVAAGSLIRVSVGANDSGGAGFRLLRVPN